MISGRILDTQPAQDDRLRDARLAVIGVPPDVGARVEPVSYDERGDRCATLLAWRLSPLYLIVLLALLSRPWLLLEVIFVPLVVLGRRDYKQERRNILRGYPIL